MEGSQGAGQGPSALLRGRGAWGEKYAAGAGSCRCRDPDWKESALDFPLLVAFGDLLLSVPSTNPWG